MKILGTGKILDPEIFQYAVNDFGNIRQLELVSIGSSLTVYPLERKNWHDCNI